MVPTQRHRNEGAHDMEAPRTYDFKNLHYRGEGGVLISLLQEAQTEDGYISRERIAEIHRKTGVPLSQIFGVATFYAQFRLKPVGRNVVKVCHGTACHVANAPGGSPFQLTAARRRLEGVMQLEFEPVPVSTHSRPKAAGHR